MYLTRSCGNWNLAITHTTGNNDVSYPQLRELKRCASNNSEHHVLMYLTRSCGNWNLSICDAFLIRFMYLTRSCGNWNVKLLYHFARFHRMYLTRSCGNWNRLADVELTIKERCILPAVAGIETRCGLHKRCFWVMYLTRNCGNWNGLTPLSDRTGLFDVSYPQLRELKLSLAMIITESERTCILPATAGILF